MSLGESGMGFETRQSVELHAPINVKDSSHQGGLKLFGVLHLPEHFTPPFPAVLMIHGLAGTKAGRHRLYVRLAEKLSKMGIASLRLDMRGCGDSEGDFSRITVDTQVADALLGLDFLTSHPFISKDQIGILGRSMGGAVAVLVAKEAMKRQTMTLCSMALWCPLFSAKPWAQEWYKMQQQPQVKGVTSEAHRHYVQQNGILFQDELVSMKLLEQLFRLDLTPALEELRDIPFFFAHSINDPVVGIEQTQGYLQQREALQASAETKFCSFQGKDHEFSLPNEQSELLEESSKWFHHSLCGQKNPTCTTQKNS